MEQTTNVYSMRIIITTVCFIVALFFSNNSIAAEEVITKKDYQWFQLEIVSDAETYCRDFLILHPEGSCVKNERIETTYYPNDPMYVYNMLWSLDTINILKAWELTRGTGTSVAVIDSGIDYRHEDLAENIKINTEGNIFGCPGDDTFGCKLDSDARNGGIDHDPIDTVGHGTHVAGIIAAVANNDAGLVGIAPEAKLVPVKIISNYTTVYDLGVAIDYAIARHVDVINISLAFGTYSEYIKVQIQKAVDNGIVVVVAAGNQRSDLNNSAPLFVYPCQYDNVICVGSSSKDDTVSNFSNYSNRFVHLFAPGASIYSTLPNNHYYSMNGTSMATPAVSATALLLKSMFNFSPTQIRDIIVQNVDIIDGLSSSVSGGRLNVADTVFQSDVERKRTLQYATFDIKRNAKLIRAKLYRTFDLMPIVRQTVYLQCSGDYAYRKRYKTNKEGLIKVFPTPKPHKKIRCWLKTSFVKYGLTKQIRSDIFKK